MVADSKGVVWLCEDILYFLQIIIILTLYYKYTKFYNSCLNSILYLIIIYRKAFTPLCAFKF